MCGPKFFSKFSNFHKAIKHTRLFQCPNVSLKIHDGELWDDILAKMHIGHLLVIHHQP
jgi:hypothetical protein